MLYRGADLYDLRRVVTRLGWSVRWAKEAAHTPGRKPKGGYTRQDYEDLKQGLKEAERVYMLVKLGVQP